MKFSNIFFPPISIVLFNFSSNLLEKLKFPYVDPSGLLYHMKAWLKIFSRFSLTFSKFSGENPSFPPATLERFEAPQVFFKLLLSLTLDLFLLSMYKCTYVWKN